MENKNHKEALDLVRSMVANGHITQEIAEQYFPELKDSGDERIRKAIKLMYSFLPNNPEYIGGVPIKEIFAWLEKQGEHAKFRDTIQVGDKVTRNEDGVLVNLSQLKRVAKPAVKQGEQKPADKVEPKFKVGDWVVVNDGRTGRIIKCTKYFADVDLKFSRLSTGVNNIRLWTIQDAKDGDVIFYDSGWTCIFNHIHGMWYSSHCFITADGEFHTSYEEHLVDAIINGNANPATKEQRDFLFQKMKEAGYSFDFEKKELKKIEQKPAENKGMNLAEENMTPFQKKVFCIVDTTIEEEQGLSNICNELLSLAIQDIEQKPAWSEEDEDKMQIIINIIKDSDPDWEELIDWLKSIKDRYT